MTHLHNPVDPYYIVTCALLSIDVYLNDASPKHSLLENWERFLNYVPEERSLGFKNYYNMSIPDVADVEKIMEQDRISPVDFFARLYCHKITKEPIIAFRGTSLLRLGDLKADWDITTSAWGSYDNAALNFYNQATNALNLSEKNKKHPIHIPLLTGHSLGGYLAQIVADSHAASNTVAVVFNAPGIGGLYNPNTQHTMNNRNVNIHNIVLEYDRVHTYGGPQTGNIYTVYNQDNCAIQFRQTENYSKMRRAYHAARHLQSYANCGFYVEHIMDTLYPLLQKQENIALNIEQKIKTHVN